MTSDSFQRRAQASDDLIALDSSASWLANPALYPLRDHPALNRSHDTQASISFRQFLGFVRAWIRQFVASISRLRAPGRHIKALSLERGSRPGQVVLFVSHDVPGAGTVQGVDFYFGAIPRELDAYVIAIDHGPLSKQIFSRSRLSSGRMRIPPGLGLVIEAKILREALTGLMRVLREIWRENDPAMRSLLREALLRSAEAASSLRIGYMTGIATKVLKPDALVLTFEGHPWERLAISEAKRAEPDLVALAYPHAGILPNQHAFFRVLGGNMDPDGFLAPGNSSAVQLKDRLPGMPVQVLGSSRLLSSGPRSRNEDLTCLVLPEGLLSETRKLVGASLSLAKLHPQINFLIRLHPALALDSSLQKALSEASSVPNISVSDGLLVNDAARSQWCLYRGSTAAVMVAATGVTPIYLHLPGTAVIDPLFDLWEGATVPAHAATGIEEVSRRLTEGYECARCVETARGYFTAPDPCAVRALSRSVRQSRMGA